MLCYNKRLIFYIFFFCSLLDKCLARSGVFEPGSGVIDGGRRRTTENMVVATTGRAHHAYRAEGSGIRQKSTG